MTTVQEKYPLIVLIWLAKHLHESVRMRGHAERTKIIVEFNLEFPEIKLTKGKLARIYLDHGGDRDAFIGRYRHRKLLEETMNPREVVPAPPNPHEELARLLQGPRADIFDEPPDLKKEPLLKEKRKIAEGLLHAQDYNAISQSVLELSPTEIIKIVLRNGGIQQFLERMGYIPKVARLAAQISTQSKR